MAKIMIMGEDPIVRFALCWIGIDGKEYKIPYNKGNPTYMELDNGVHEIYVTTESRLSRNSDVNDGSISGTLSSFAISSTNAYAAYEVTVSDDSIVYIFVQQSIKPKIHFEITNQDNLNKVMDEINSAVIAAQKSSFNRFTGFLWLLVSLIPLAGIAAGLYHLCRKQKRIVIGVFCILFSVISTLCVGGVLLGDYAKASVKEIDGNSNMQTISESTTNSHDQESIPDTTEYDIHKQDPIVKYVIAESGLELREGPGTEYNILKLIENYAQVQVFTIENNWAYAEYDGDKGWCPADFLFDSIDEIDTSKTNYAKIYYDYLVEQNCLESYSNNLQETFQYNVHDLFYFLDDINYDGIPELVVSDKSFNELNLTLGILAFTYSDGHVIKLFDSGMPFSSGVYTYSLVTCDGRYGTLYLHQNSTFTFRYYTIETDGSFTEQVSGYISSFEQTIWLLNEIEVSKDEFYNKFNTFEPITAYFDLEQLYSLAQ